MIDKDIFDEIIKIMLKELKENSFGNFYSYDNIIPQTEPENYLLTVETISDDQYIYYTFTTNHLQKEEIKIQTKPMTLFIKINKIPERIYEIQLPYEVIPKKTKWTFVDVTDILDISLFKNKKVVE